jgi:V8-like Glu-specific endopeptidase
MSYAANKDTYPGSTVVLVQSTCGGQTFVGSGVIVGKNDVITAAHVVYIQSLGGLADAVKIYPLYSPQLPQKTFYQPIQILYPSAFVQVDQDGDGRFFRGDNRYGSYAESEIDIALLSFDLDLAGAYGSMPIRYEFGAGNVGVLGYPGKYGNNLTYDDGFISKDPVDGVYLFDSSLEINPGNSGSPIYYNDGGGPHVVGLVSTSNWAVGLEQHRDWLAARMKANDVFFSGSTVTSRSVATYPGSSRAYQFLSLGGELYGVKGPLGAVDVITGSNTISFDDRSFDYYDDIVDVFFSSRPSMRFQELSSGSTKQPLTDSPTQMAFSFGLALTAQGNPTMSPPADPLLNRTNSGVFMVRV